MRTADKITLSRIFLAPVIFALYHAPLFAPGAARPAFIALLPLTAFAEFSDFLDGYYARRHGEVSDFGKIFDPFADVLLHLTLFLCFVKSGYLPLFIMLLILYREFAMLFFRLVAMQRGVTIAARKGGKAKTVLYITAIFFTLCTEGLARFGVEAPVRELRAACVALFSLCAAASYASFVEYLLHFRRLFKK